MPKSDKTPRKHTTPRARKKRVGPGGSYRDWDGLETTATWAPPARSGQRTDVRTGRPLNELIKGALEKRANTFVQTDPNALLPPRPQQPPVVPQPAGRPAEPPAAGPTPPPPAGLAASAPLAGQNPPAPQGEAARIPGVPMVVPNDKQETWLQGQQQQRNNKALWAGNVSSVPYPTQRPEGWWDWVTKLLGGWWHQFTGAGTADEYAQQYDAQRQQQYADEYAKARQADIFARKSVYHGGGTAQYAQDDPRYADDAATMRALTLGMESAGTSLYDATGQRLPGVDAGAGRVWDDQGAGIWDNLRHGYYRVTGNDKAQRDLIQMRNDKTDYEQFARLHGMRGDEAQYDPAAQAGQAAPDTFHWTEGGRVESDPEAMRLRTAQMARMSEDVRQGVTPENMASLTGMEYFGGRLLPAQEAIRLHAENHMREMGYNNLAEFHADGWRMGPGGALVYPERFKEFVGKSLASEVEHVVNKIGVSGDRAIELARQNLIMKGMYIPGGDTMTRRHAGVASAAREMISAGAAPEEAWAKAEEQAGVVPYDAGNLYAEVMGGRDRKGMDAKALQVQGRIAADKEEQQYRRFTPINFVDRLSNEASAFAQGVGNSLGNTTYGLLDTYGLRNHQLTKQQLSRDIPEYFGRPDDIDWSAGLGLGKNTFTGAYDASTGAAQAEKQRYALTQALSEANPDRGVGEGSRLTQTGGNLAGTLLSGFGVGSGVVRAVGASAPAVPLLTRLAHMPVNVVKGVGSAAKRVVPYVALDAADKHITPMMLGDPNSGVATDLAQRALARAANVSDPDIRASMLNEALMPFAPELGDREALADRVINAERGDDVLQDIATAYGADSDVERNIARRRSMVDEIAAIVASGKLGANQLMQLVQAGQLTEHEADMVLSAAAKMPARETGADDVAGE